MAKILCALDYEGVIADSLERNLTALQRACRRLGHERLPTRQDIELLDNMVFSELAALLGVKEKTYPTLQNLVREELGLGPIRPAIFPGMQTILSCMARDMELAVVTANSMEIVHRELESFDVLEHFKHISGGESGRDKSCRLRGLMEKMQTAPQQTVMIGDAVSDILMARKTGARTIAVSWGFQSEKRLKQADPDALARKPEDLPEILTRWFF